jgi:hypothetical protein
MPWYQDSLPECFFEKNNLAELREIIKKDGQLKIIYAYIAFYYYEKRDEDGYYPEPKDGDKIIIFPLIDKNCNTQHYMPSEYLISLSRTPEKNINGEEIIYSSFVKNRIDKSNPKNFYNNRINNFYLWKDEITNEVMEEYIKDAKDDYGKFEFKSL